MTIENIKSLEERLNELKDNEKLMLMDADNLRDLLLEYLEQKVGSRDMTWEVTNTIYDEDAPMTSYPDGYDKKNINIVLTSGTKEYPQQKLFQVSHEVVHLLDPTNKIGANNLEEGFAAWFSIYICEYAQPTYESRARILRNESLYKEQFKLIDKLNNPFTLIKEIRDNGNTMYNVPEIFLKEHTEGKYTEKEIKFLLENFKSWNDQLTKEAQQQNGC